MKRDELAFFSAVKSDLKVFMRLAFETIYPGKEYLDGWHVDAVLHCLEVAPLV